MFDYQLLFLILNSRLIGVQPDAKETLTTKRHPNKQANIKNIRHTIASRPIPKTNNSRAAKLKIWFHALFLDSVEKSAQSEHFALPFSMFTRVLPGRAEVACE
jgi:hypothetical protein